MRKLASAIALAATACTLSLPAAAQSFSKPEDAVKYRQSVMYVMQIHTSQLFRMANGRIPFDAKAANESADAIAAVSRLPWVAFGPGTDKISKAAKPEIWSEPAKFKDHADKFMAEVPKVVAAARTNDVAAIRAAVGAMGNSCKACHDNFQKD